MASSPTFVLFYFILFYFVIGLAIRNLGVEDMVQRGGGGENLHTSPNTAQGIYLVLMRSTYVLHHNWYVDNVHE